MENGKHYLYRHIRIDKNEVFYIGIGTKRLIEGEYRRANCSKYRNSFWKRINKKSKIKVEIICESDNYNFIQQKEKEFIKLYGRRDLKKGTLSNLTDGGGSIIGYKRTKETNKEVSAKMIQNHKTGKMNYKNLKRIMVINIITNKVYNSIREAAEDDPNYNESQLCAMLSGKRIDRSNLRKCKITKRKNVQLLRVSNM